MIALITKQGTACAESGLCSLHDSSAERAKVKAKADPDAFQWMADVTNPDINCVVCGASTDHETEKQAAEPKVNCPMCGQPMKADDPGHDCFLGDLLDTLIGRGFTLTAEDVLKLDLSVPDNLWEQYAAPAADFLEAEFYDVGVFTNE